MAELLIATFSPWLVVGCLLVCLMLFLHEISVLFESLLQLQRKTLYTLLLIIILSTFIRFWMVPNTHRIYFDEDRYLNFAVTFARFGSAHSIVLATPEKLIQGDFDQVARITVPVVNGIVLKVTDYNQEALFTFAKASSIFQILLLFALTLLLFRSERVSIIATGIFAFLPVPLFWSTSVGLDSFFVLFALLNAVAAMWYAVQPGWKSACFGIASTVLILFVRLEAFLFLFVDLALLLSYRNHTNQVLITKRDLQFVALATPFIASRALVSLSVFGQTWCCGESTPLEAFGMGYLFRNLLPNLGAFISKPEIPVVLTILAGAVLFGKKDWRVLPLGLWMSAYFLIYSLYFAGMFFTLEFSGSYGRYALMLFPPMSILAALGVEEMILWGSKNKKNHFRMRLLFFIAVLFSLPTLFHFRTMVSQSPYEQYVDANPRRMNEFLTRVARDYTEPNAVLIHALTNISLLYGKPAVYFGAVIADPEVLSYVLDEIDSGTPVYMFQTHTCTVDQQKCKLLLDQVELVPVELPESETSGLEIVRLVRR